MPIDITIGLGVTVSITRSIVITSKFITSELLLVVVVVVELAWFLEAVLVLVVVVVLVLK